MRPATEEPKPAAPFRVVKNRSWGYLLYGAKEMIAGFTGTRHGMTGPQEDTLFKLLGMSKVKFFHSGDCVGADAQAYAIVQALNFAGANIVTVGHPPSDPKARAFCDYEEVKAERPYLVRNRVIVNESDCLFAAPKEYTEQVRGGTWFTVRYARQKKKVIMLIWPDGTLDVQHPSEYSPVPWSHAMDE